jgi:hypothetical protein
MITTDKPKAVINILKLTTFLYTTRHLNLTGNKDNDLASSNENENIFRKKGLNSHSIIRKFTETSKGKYCSFILKNSGMRINARIRSIYP